MTLVNINDLENYFQLFVPDANIKPFTGRFELSIEAIKPNEENIEDSTLILAYKQESYNIDIHIDSNVKVKNLNLFIIPWKRKVETAMVTGGYYHNIEVLMQFSSIKNTLIPSGGSFSNVMIRPEEVMAAMNQYQTINTVAVPDGFGDHYLTVNMNGKSIIIKSAADFYSSAPTIYK
jgi:hypothetical protein